MIMVPAMVMLWLARAVFDIPMRLVDERERRKASLSEEKKEGFIT